MRAAFAEVGDLAIEFMFAGVNGKAGMGGEIIGEELLDVGRPRTVEVGGWCGTGGASGTQEEEQESGGRATRMSHGLRGGVVKGFVFWFADFAD